MTSLRLSIAAAGAAVLLSTAMLGQISAASAAEGVRVPPPAFSTPATAPTETAIFAGGCFWGVQGVFAHVKGVKSAVSGYAGGDRASANYEAVGSGRTGHAEAVRVTFDPRVVSYAQLLQIYFSVVADPTQLNYQGPDHGPQYRGALFPTTPQQKAVATRYIAQLGKAGIWKRPIVTRIEPATGFFAAEAYHQDYFWQNPNSSYIRINDVPKVKALKAFYPGLWRDRPSLVKG